MFILSLVAVASNLKPVTDLNAFFVQKKTNKYLKGVSPNGAKEVSLSYQWRPSLLVVSNKW